MFVFFFYLTLTVGEGSGNGLGLCISGVGLVFMDWVIHWTRNVI